MTRCALILIIFLVAPTAAAAEDRVTFQFRGEIARDLPEPYSVLSGGRFEIIFTIDADTPDSNPDDPDSGVYFNAFVRAQVKVMKGRRSFAWELDAATMNEINVQRTPTAHALFAGAYLLPDPTHFSPLYFIVQLVDRDLEAFSSDALPLELDLEQFEWLRNVQLTFDATCCATFGEVTDVRVRRQRR